MGLTASMIAAGLLLAGAALAQEPRGQLGAPAVPLTHSVEQADAKLAQVNKDRDAAEAEYAASEQVCYKKFFVNDCLDKAKEKRRARLADLRAIEIEANYFKRRNAVEVRDRELEDRAQRDKAEEASRAANPPKPHTNPADKPAPVPLKVLPAQRQAEHDARVRQHEAAEASKAGERAKKVEEFQQKQVEATQRQQRVAQKKAEREAKQARRAADEAAKKAAEAEKAKNKAQ